MKYPILARSDLRALANQRVQGLEASAGPLAVWVGTGAEIDLSALKSLGVELALEVGTSEITDRDRFEGESSIALWNCVGHLPVDVLDDKRFWSYAAMAFFWDFIAWREEQSFSRGHFVRYLDGESSTESVLTRMYLRASAVGGAEYADLVGAIPKGTDFWRSHITRVRTGSAPAVARALVRSHRDERLATDDLRVLARKLNRSWTNVVLYFHEDAEAAELISDLRLSLIRDESRGANGDLPTGT